MGYFNRDRRPSGRRDFERRSFGGRGGDRQMHKTICTSCGKECEVPFKPSSDKPVYCSDCFEKNRRGSDTGRFGDRNFKRPNFGDRDNRTPPNTEHFKELNAKLDKILEILNPGSSVKSAPVPTPEPQLPVISERPEEVVVEKKKRIPKKAVLLQKK